MWYINFFFRNIYYSLKAVSLTFTFLSQNEKVIYKYKITYNEMLFDHILVHDKLSVSKIFSSLANKTTLFCNFCIVFNSNFFPLAPFIF